MNQSITPVPLSPVALTIAGSDSGGNAGIQADLRAFHVFGVHGCTAITALTAQNPLGVSHIQPTSLENLTAQLNRICTAYTLGAVKTGMLVNVELINVVIAAVEQYAIQNIVIDPVMIATSGAKLIDDTAIKALTALCHHATLITPNVPEAEVLLGATSSITPQTMQSSAEALAARFNCGVLLKGGHNHNQPAHDIFTCKGETYSLSTPVVENPISTHGTGCSLSSALAAILACDPKKGKDILNVVIFAKAYIYEAIRTGVYVGEGSGVLGMPTYHAVCSAMDNVTFQRL